MIFVTTDLPRDNVKQKTLRCFLDSPVSAFSVDGVVSSQKISARCVEGEAVAQCSHYTHPVR